MNTKILFGDFTIQSTSDGRKYVEYTGERDTQKQDLEHEYDHCTFKPKMWATLECLERYPILSVLSKNDQKVCTNQCHIF